MIKLFIFLTIVNLTQFAFKDFSLKNSTNTLPELLAVVVLQTLIGTQILMLNKSTIFFCFGKKN